jgi:transaldolase/glucose-6-phosphate isomerase
VSAALEDWRAHRKVARLWQRDATLWTGGDEARWLDWLTIVESSRERCDEVLEFSEEVRTAGFTHALLMGMGGSSLCPEVLIETFGQLPGAPELRILDSTDPARLLAAENGLDFPRTLFIVSSKSGSTLEPNLFKDYFLDRMRQVVGKASAGAHFVAITDPGSKMQEVAVAEGFRRIFLGVPGIGGRYSALSSFGMVPAAILGMDVRRFLHSAAEMVKACSPDAPVEENPGVVLGCLLGTLALRGRDKVTFLTSPEIRDLGAWLEQLLAESTGKQGKGLIPVDRELPGPPRSYGADRVFVSLGLSEESDVARESAVAELERSGHPVVRIILGHRYDLGQEFFRWEIATAVAGSILGIHPFDQPDVEASKIATRELTESYERSGSLPAEEPLLEEGPLQLYADPVHAAMLARRAGQGADVTALLKAHLDHLEEGDYFALLAYLEMSPQNEALLQALREIVRERKRVATCLGFGPRFLHSTGQAYKGGPNRGVFLQVTCKDERDVAVPGRNLTFGAVKAAQALGDFQVLAQRRRRALRVHLTGRIAAGLERLGRSVERALAAVSPAES